MDKILFYESLVSEIKKRSLSGEIAADGEERGNLAYLSEICPEGEYEQYLAECRELDDNELCWKLFNTLYDDQLAREKTEDEKDLDRVLFKGYKLMHSFKMLHDFVCVHSEQFPEWFYIHEKLDTIRNP